jgi:sulfate adenylyltransferase subunit 1 (EFTu-like GTPase family)
MRHETARMARIVTADGDLGHSIVGQAVTFTLSDDSDVSRGDVILDGAAVPDRFDAPTTNVS